jgi:transposase-like protein
MSNRIRRRFTPEQKAAILRRHLVDKVAVSRLCDEYKLQPSVFYTWHRQLLENLAVALDAGSGEAPARERELVRKVEALEARLAKKDSVIAEREESVEGRMASALSVRCQRSILPFDCG